MEKRTYAVMGATGQVGHVVVEQLLKQGHRVRAIGRDQQKLNWLQSRGADPIILNQFDNKDALTKALRGVDGAFCFIPPGQGVEKYGLYQDSVGEAIKEAVAKNSIHHVVNLSSVGANLQEGTGPIKGLYRQEQRLNTLKDINLLHLRPTFFMENFFWSIPGIAHLGILKMPLNPELNLAMVSTGDIGAKAAEFLDKLDFQGHQVFELEGPRSLALVEATGILGRAIGESDLKYAQLSYEEVRQGMLANGVRGDMPDLLIEMYRALNENKCQPTQNLTADHRGKITIEMFASQFAEGYQMMLRQRASVS